MNDLFVSGMEAKKGVWMKEKVDSRSSPSSLPRRCFAVVVMAVLMTSQASAWKLAFVSAAVCFVSVLSIWRVGLKP